MGYLTTHPLPTPGNLGKQPELPKKPLSCPLHAASAVLPLPKMKCGGYRRKEPVQSTAGEGRDLFSIPFQGSKHSTVHVYSPYLHSPICSLLLHSQCLQTPRELGQVCSPQLCARGLWSHHRAQQHQTLSPARRGPGCATPTPWTALMSPRLLLEELAAAPAEHEAVGQQSCPAGCHEPGLAAAVAER